MVLIFRKGPLSPGNRFLRHRPGKQACVLFLQPVYCKVMLFYLQGIFIFFSAPVYGQIAQQANNKDEKADA